VLPRELITGGANGKGCTKIGVCGKDPEVSALQDLLVYTLKGLWLSVMEGKKVGVHDHEVNLFLTNASAPPQKEGREGTKATLGKQPLIKILDWGIAGLNYPKGQSNTELLQSLANGILGTADYISPEQARDSGSADTRSMDALGKAVSRDEILDKAWSADEFPTSRTVDNFIVRLRKLVEPDPDEPHVIRSIRGVGYLLTEVIHE
jgi:serine/threonine protein kinase